MQSYVDCTSHVQALSAVSFIEEWCVKKNCPCFVCVCVCVCVRVKQITDFNSLQTMIALADGAVEVHFS